MSASTTFKASIRGAGELTDHRLYGSFRSLHRYEAPILKSKHEDIFKSKEFESTIIPLPPKPHSANEVVATKNENANEQSKEKKSTKERGSSGRRSKRGGSGEESKKNRHHRHKKSEQDKEEEEKKDEEFLKYLGERHERRRKKHTTADEQINQDSNPNKENASEAPVSLRRINSSKERLNHRGQEQEQEQNGDRKQLAKQENKSERTKSKSDRTKFITKTNAFNESEDSDSDKDNKEDNSNEVEVDIQKNNSKQELKLTQNSDYFKMILNFNTMNFLLTPAPHGQTIMCKILCRRGLINEYHFYLELADSANMLLLKTQRKMTSAKPSHLINIVNYNDQGQKSVNEISCAKVSSNMARKKFKLVIDTSNFPSVESNILSVLFKSNSGEPRKVIATASLCSGTSANKEKVTYFLKNRQPYYDINMRKFVLNYNGRAKQSSKNNFQIVDESFPDDILMQLGKVETGEYNCDFTWPLCAMQAFGLALASLSR